MNRYELIALILFISIGLFAGIYFLSQAKGGELVQRKFKSESLLNNFHQENAIRPVSIYLPPSYKQSKDSYPTLYFLHGFGISDEYEMAKQFKPLLDKAIQNKIIPEVIVVFPNSYTKFKGSFYTNSDIAGRWADYIAIDLVHYIDENFRTKNRKQSRAICGHSMGGNGALKLAMLFPEVFSSVYALSPSILYWAEELVPENPAFERIQEAKTLESVYDDLYAIGFLSMASTYTPNPNKAPLYCDLPVFYENGEKKIDSLIFNKWEKRFPLKMAETHSQALKSLKGIAFDWGTEDEFAHLPVTCKMLNELLEVKQIPHQAEAYHGGHSDKLLGKSGRIYQKMLPFFAIHLE